MRPDSQLDPCPLVDIIDFKWMMAAEGHRVHVERMQADTAYARQCLALALASPSTLLQALARRLGGTLPASA